MNFKLALIGFGGVNRALVELIDKQSEYLSETAGISLEVVAISDIFLGSIVDPAGISLETLLNVPAEKGVLSKLKGGADHSNNISIIESCNANVVVEATFTDAVTGEPATSHCRTALQSGKHVVTTNKGPIALHLAELEQLASANAVGIEYEGAVMSGTPVLRMAEKCLLGNRITGFRGILNGTANYILEQLEKGSSIDSAIAQAQALGYAEADPSADIEGFDVMLKVVILANQLLGTSITTNDVARQGITSLSEEKIKAAAKNGKRWKLIGSAKLTESGLIKASVMPIELDGDDILAGVSGATNAVCMDTALLGEVMVSGPGAGKIETAFALLSDIIALKSKFS